MGASIALRRWLVVSFSSVSLLALCIPGAVTAAPVGVKVTYTACIELTGDPETRRDLKLRQGPCHKNERQVAWPPGTTGPAGEAGPQGPAGATGPAGPIGATGPAGVAGAPGAAGPMGATGATGATGANGSNGSRGRNRSDGC